MRTNAFVRDLDVPDANAGDGRRLEVVVDGLPLFGGWQLAVDTTLVCAVRVKERRYPEFVGVQARARLVVLAVEVGVQVLEGDEWVPDRAGQGSGTERNPTHAEAC